MRGKWVLKINPRHPIMKELKYEHTFFFCSIKLVILAMMRRHWICMIDAMVIQLSFCGCNGLFIAGWVRPRAVKLNIRVKELVHGIIDFDRHYKGDNHLETWVTAS